jgi:predicted esterase
VSCLFTASALAQPQSVVDQFEERSQTFEGFTLEYRLFVPEDYDPETTYPLVLTLHGAGERGSNNESQIAVHRIATTWADPANQAEDPTFVVSPQVPPGRRWSAEQPADQSDFTDVQLTTLAILDALAAEFTIDPDRVYVTGLSMGGHGTWDLIARLPNRFAAAVPMSGRTYAQNADDVLAMPIWAFHGESDGVVEAAGTRRIVQAMEDLGRQVIYTDCRRSPPLATNYDCPGPIASDSLAEAIDEHADLIFTAAEDVGHGPWSPWYDHPLLFDWVFSKFRLDPDAIALTEPTQSAVWTGTNEVTWGASGTPEDGVEVWVSLNNGADWDLLGETALGAGGFSFDTAAFPDTPFARVRVFARNDRGFIYGRTTSGPFTFDNAGDAAPTLVVNDEPLRFDPVVTQETLELEVLAADPEGDALATTVYYSVDGGGTFAQIATTELASSQEPQAVSVGLVPLPNSLEARLRIEVSDGTSTASATTATFAKENPREDLPFVEQVEGDGNGTVTVRFIQPDALTGHRYRITIDSTNPEAKTYSVTDLATTEQVLTDIPLSDGVRESPLFDGMTLVVEDLAEGMPNLDETGWVEGDTDMGVAISGGEVRIAILTIDLLATETDYELTVTETVADTSIARYGIPAEELYFSVTGRDDGIERDVIFDADDQDGRLDDGDILYILEPDPDDASEPAWRLTFEATDETVLPEAGDVFRFVPLRSLGSDDVFEFLADPSVDAESAPDAAGFARLASYPNPFVDRLTVGYSLQAPAEVTIEVFDVLGRRVAVLVEGVVEAGEHHAAWSDDARVASGVHVLRLTARPLAGGPAHRVQRSVVRISD